MKWIIGSFPLKIRILVLQVFRICILIILMELTGIIPISQVPGSKWIFLWFIVVFDLLPYLSDAQEALGIVNSNYSGVNTLWINPANAVVSRNRISLNILAGDIFIISDYLFIHRKDYGFLKPFRVDINDPQYMYLHEYPDIPYTDTVHYYDYYNNGALKNFFFNARIAGPSLLLRFGNHSLSFMTAFRNNFSGSFIPQDVMNFGYRGLDFEPQHHVSYDDKSFEFAGLSWIELGAGYTYTFLDNDENKLSAGITLKYLMGTAATYGTVRNVNYMVPYQDTLIVYNMNSIFGMALPVNYATNEFIMDPFVKGRGFGGDIGIVYQRLPGRFSGNARSASKADEQEDNYLFRVGVSLLDVGQIRFTNSVQVHKFENVTNQIWPGLINYQATSIQQFFRSASYNFLGDSLASLSGQTSFRIWLPSAFSAQVDYHFGKNFFVNASIVQGIRIGSPGVRRESLVALTPRYETPVWEINLPLSLVDYQHPAIGLALRVYSLIIGTEKLGTFLNLTDVKGMDLYFSIGININPKKEAGSVSKNRFSGKRIKGCESLMEYKRYQVH
jgi:hypothetical protein